MAAFLILSAVICEAQLPEREMSLALANVENPRQSGPLHIFKDKKKTTHDKLVLYSVHGSLFNDDPAYNKKYPLWIPAAETFGVLGTVWVFDRYVSKEDYAFTTMETWKHNLAAGWEWDNDNLYLNFFMHPYSGAVFFNTARSNGYSFYESIPFAFGGGLLWEYFGENTLPAYNDIINTSITGPLIGEMQYRLSSNILNDKTTGSERFFRELGAALVDPVRGFNRLIQGTAYGKTSQEIYQKEPVNIVVSLGSRWANEGSKFGTGPGNQTVDVNLDYGYPFEYRDRKPFDYFRFWGDLYFGGAGDKVINNVMGYGIWYGENFQYKNMEVLAGIFQHYNYWDTSTFELATIAFEGGILTKLPLGKGRSLLTNFHLGIIPLAGNNTIDGPTGSELRDYNYANGMQTELESTLKLGRLSLVFVGYYYWIHTFVGDKEDNYIGILKPRISVDINEFLSVGFEQLFYLSDRYPADFHEVHLKRTEQKLYISYFFKDPWYDR
ncbi:MAG: DUF3943 domain-containing protein [Elusimicrobia bacterium]|nr:DUF3943 domain-containing protein [Elusimicrobiota bacterium]